MDTAAEYLRKIPALFVWRRDNAPIQTVAALEDFIVSRAAYQAQKTLYSYIKARMGIRYPAMFEDTKMIASINIAKMNYFAACLSDLTIYAVAHATDRQAIGNDDRATLALEIYRAGLAANADEAPSAFSAEQALGAFEKRLAEANWSAALTPGHFTESPEAMFRWAPISEKLKRFDREIVNNAVTFAWRDIREHFLKRIDAAAVSADLRKRGPAA